MSKNPFFNMISLGLISAGLAVAGCSTSSDHPGLDSDEIPAPSVAEGEYGLNLGDVTTYFSTRAAGDDAEYSGSGQLAADQIGGASEYVWNLWKKVVARNAKERLPELTSHYRYSSWGDIRTPDATWALDNSKMYVFYGSKGERPADGYPLILFLHGSGADAMGEWTVTLAWNQVFDDGPSAYFVPKSPYGGTSCRWFQPSRQEKWEQVLRQALASDDINPMKVYFAGISEGAYGTQRLSAFYSDYIAGAAPIAGGEFMAECPPENLATVAYCMQTGGNDTSYGRADLTKGMGETLDALAAAHPGSYTHKVDLQPGATHSSTDYTVATPWVVRHSRTSAPKYFHYENFGMGGINDEGYRYRDAFYNIQVLESSDSRDNQMRRTAYDVTITDNTVDIKVDNVEVTTPSTYTVAKSHTAAKSGKIRVYLNDDLVNLSQPVVIKVNGKEKFNGKLEPDTKYLVESCALFYDPARVFPAAADVTVD